MRDHLLDLVSHTLDLGCIEQVKIVGTDKETNISGLAGILCNYQCDILNS